MTAEEMAASGTLPQFFPENLGKLAGQVAKDPAAFAGGDSNKGRQLLSDLKGAGTQGRAEEEERAYEEWRESFDNTWKAGLEKAQEDADKRANDQMVQDLNKEAAGGKANWEASLKAARESKSFLTAAPGQMTPAEKEAARLDAADNGPLKRAKEQFPELDNMLSSVLKGSVLEGGSMAQARQGLFDRLAGQIGDDAANAFLDQASKDARGSLIADQINAAGEMAGGSVKVLQGGASLRDSIQSAVKADEKQEKLIREAVRSNQLLEELVRGGGLG